MLSKTKKVITTPPPVLCSVASYQLFYSTTWSVGTLSLLFVPPAEGGGMEINMEFPTLKFPEKHGRMEAEIKYESGQLDPKGFAATYFAALEKAESNMNTRYECTYSQEYNRNSERELLNREFDNIRRQIAKEMQKYLIEHDGQIDFWPDCGGRHNLSDGKYKFIFHYFGDDFEVRQESIRRKSKELIYHNAYTVEEDEGYFSAERHKYRLQSDMDSAKELAHPIFALVFGFVGFYLAFFFFAFLCCMIFGLDAKLVSLLENVKAMPNSFFSNLLEKLCTLLVLPGIAAQQNNGDLNTIALVFSTVGACIFIYFGFGYRKENRLYRYYKRKYYKYLRSDEYKQQKRMDKEYIPKGNAFAEEWQRAWFEWAKYVGDIPENTE